MRADPSPTKRRRMGIVISGVARPGLADQWRGNWLAMALCAEHRHPLDTWTTYWAARGTATAAVETCSNIEQRLSHLGTVLCQKYSDISSYSRDWDFSTTLKTLCTHAFK